MILYFMKVLGTCWIFLVLLVTSEAISAPIIFDHPNPQAGANFGAAMASVGDIDSDGIPDLLVGAPRQDVGGNADQGQVYLLSGSTGALLLTLDNPFPQADAQFGSSIASAGDIDDDGKNDLFVGAPSQDIGSCEIGDTSGCSVGQAFVFSGDTGALLLTLNHPTPHSGAFFGSAVASTGDINGDLVPDLIVGTPGQSVGVFVSSQVFVFDGLGGTLLLTLNDPNPPETESDVGSTFGSVVASVGDINNDSVPDIVVGDGQQDVAGNIDQGQVHIFSGANGNLLLTLNNPNPQAGAFFGASAASVGDIDNDGVPDILIGASKQDVGGNFDQGQAYLFSGADGALLITLDNPNPPQVSSNFGSAVAFTGDVDGDAVPDLLVGAPGQTVNGVKQGQAVVFSGSDSSVLLTLDNPTAQADANFGAAVISGGDIDNDGKPDPLVAAPFQNVGTNPLQGQVGLFESTGVGNQAPVANAGPDQTINEGSLVNLDGSASSDPDSDPLIFTWTQTAGPSVTLSDPSSATPIFTAPQVSTSTVLTFQLVVNDGTLDSSPDTVNITVLNVTEGPDLVGTFTQLDLSSGRKGDSLSFTLSVTNIGNKATSGGFTVEFYLSEDNTLDALDELVFSKTLKDKGSEGKIQPGNSITISKTLNLGDVGPAQFLIAVIDSKNTIPETNEGNNITSGQFTTLPPPEPNQAPIADAGADQTVDEGSLVTLNGSASSDPDGDAITFTWTQTAGPTAPLSDPSSQNPSFTAPQVTSGTTLTFQLIVNDGQLDSDPAFVNVLVQDVGEEPPPTTEVCTTKVQAMLLKYIGPNILGATVEIIAARFKNSPVVYSPVDLISGITTLSSAAENGFTIDATAHGQRELGAKTLIRINGVEEKLHTSCSTPFESGKPAPLDRPLGDPSPNWFVVNFTQK